jgi:hypothetical protein
MFQTYQNKIGRSQVFPNCNSCYKNDSMSLVDVVVDGTNNQSTTPVYHCARCEELHGERTYQVQSSIDNVHTAQIASSSITNSTNTIGLAPIRLDDGNHYQLKEDVKKVVLDNTEQVKVDMYNLQLQMINLETRLQKAEEMAADPLHELRKRVNAFSLD